MKTSNNKFAIALLLAGIATCLALLPWGSWFGPDYEQLLTDRVALYSELRQKDDWVKLYELMDERDRNAVPIRRFLALYGSGPLKVEALTEKSRSIDAEAGVADVELTLDARLLLERLPPRMRGSLQGTSPEDLQKTSEFTTQWAWSNDNWWLRMDREAVTGRNAEGKPIKTVSDG